MERISAAVRCGEVLTSTQSRTETAIHDEDLDHVAAHRADHLIDQLIKDGALVPSAGNHPRRHYKKEVQLPVDVDQADQLVAAVLLVWLKPGQDSVTSWVSGWVVLRARRPGGFASGSCRARTRKARPRGAAVPRRKRSGRRACRSGSGVGRPSP